MSDATREEPQWFDSPAGFVLAVRCAACREHPGHRYPSSYSGGREACLGCKGAAWIVLVTLPISTVGKRRRVEL
ncbi:MAG TPA: hypothetical protein VEW07_02275 [Solirubrobacterales bacterium]|nr:hypothetical protein [Solirubrobacterales bacterium]